jgi:hypothetical protein
MEDNTNIRIRLQRAEEGFSIVEVSLPEQPLKRSKTETSSDEEDREDYTMEDAPLVPLPEVPETAELPPLQPMQSVLFNASHGNQDVEPVTNVPYTGPLLAGIRPEAANYPVLVPSYSSWFDIEKIHQNEIRALPEFFNADKPQDQEKYKVIIFHFSFCSDVFEEISKFHRGGISYKSSSLFKCYIVSQTFSC